MILDSLNCCLSQARPGHPVFLDAVGRTLRKTEGIMREEREAKAKGETYMPDSALGA
jgi:alpha 1,6-mannosyltransferase